MNGKGARLPAVTLALALATSVSGCSWFTDFKEQPKIDPWESANDTTPPRGNPQNSVPVYGTVAPGYAYDRTPLPGAITAMAGIANPVPADPRSLENGRMYFQINCAVCHGESGKGDGTVTKFAYPGIGIGAGSNAANTLSDGYIFGMIRNGRGLMPSYNRIEEPDRWDIVNYLRGLQGRIPAAVVAGPVGRPGETGNKVPGASETGPTRPAPYYRRIGSQAGARAGRTAAAQQPAPGGVPRSLPAPPATDTTRRKGVQP